LLGQESMDILKKSTVAIFGIGGVGSFTAEALARSGVGNLILVDDDNICLTNINRQIHATTKTIGQDKVDVMRDRILDINPRCNVQVHKTFYSKDTAESLILQEYDYVVDAIDTVSAKIDMAQRCSNLGIRIISSMGAGNKLDPTRFEVTDISKTSVCPLAKVMRRELKNLRVKKLKVVYS
ncbi:MAG: tRNA threonylcarbamoyladenosine dehydratase, partial [Oscillospiraceae bacterium]